MEVIPLPKRGAPAEQHAAIQEAGNKHPATLAPACPQVRDVLNAGVVSQYLVFPEGGPPRSIEEWQPPIIRDKAIGEAIWSRLNYLDVWLAPAPPRELISRILVLLGHFRTPSHTDAVEQGLAKDWAECLASYPMWSIDKAARTWLRKKKFKPQISEIIELCEEEVGRLSIERKRLQSIVDATASAANPLAEKTQALARKMFKTLR